MAHRRKLHFEPQAWMALLGAALLAAGCSQERSETPAQAPATPAAEASPATPALSAAERARQISALADDYVQKMFLRYPEAATYYGVAGYQHDKLSDNSLAALSRWQTQEDTWLLQLEQIPAPLPGEEGWALYGLLRETLQGGAAYRVCRTELWGVNQSAGWHTFIPFVFEIQPVGDEGKRRDALSRAADLQNFLDEEISNLRAGLALGYSAPAHIVDIVIDEVTRLADKESPLVSPMLRDEDAQFRAAYADTLTVTVWPSLERYTTFLKDEYRPKARTLIAVTRNPDGVACYDGAVRSFSTLAMSAKDIHQTGLDTMKGLRAEMLQIAQRSFETDDVEALLIRLTDDPQYRFGSSDEMRAVAAAALGRARSAMPDWFGLQPRADVVIEPYPAYRENSGWGEYHSSSADGTRPGTFYLPMHAPEDYPRASLEPLTFHEAIPGHHLQGAIALESASGHELARYTFNSGFGEGWALYTERLADEMGLYSDDLARLGMLSSQAARAARLVVDTGMHRFDWTRQRAIDYMRSNTSWSPAEITAEIDRYIIWPGQATAYMLGMQHIMHLREEAKAQLGDRFDIRAFHDRMLENGSVSLAMLEESAQHWVKGSLESAAGAAED